MHPAFPKTISVVGPSGSGKTVLICELVAWFRRQGLKAAVLKHSHKTALGDEDKDTGRFRQAGAHFVALAAPGLLQVSYAFPGEPPLDGVLSALAPQADLVLVEGYKSSPLPKIALVGPGLEEVLPDHSRVVALVSSAPLESALPVFHPHQVAEIGRFIEQFLGLPGHS